MITLSTKSYHTQLFSPLQLSSNLYRVTDFTILLDQAFCSHGNIHSIDLDGSLEQAPMNLQPKRDCVHVITLHKDIGHPAVMTTNILVRIAISLQLLYSLADMLMELTLLLTGLNMPNVI